MDAPIQQNYINLAAQGVSSWIPLWESVAVKMEGAASHEKTLFSQAKNLFDKGADALKEKKFPEAQKSWTTAKGNLNELIHTIVGIDPHEEILRKLLAFYNYAFTQDPLIESTLIALQNEQERAIDLLPSSLRSSLQPAQIA